MILSCPEPLVQSNQDAVYRIALHSVLQVLMLVGPVIAEWHKLSFSSTFEILRRVANRLNRISNRLDALGTAGQEAADERYDLTHRDFLLQRFFRVEAGTVRMTTNLAADLPELFVIPRVRVRSVEADDAANTSEAEDLMAEKLKASKMPEPLC